MPSTAISSMDFYEKLMNLWNIQGRVTSFNLRLDVDTLATVTMKRLGTLDDAVILRTFLSTYHLVQQDWTSIDDALPQGDMVLCWTWDARYVCLQWWVAPGKWTRITPPGAQPDATIWPVVSWQACFLPPAPASAQG